MPHIIVKLYAGKSEEQKARLTEKIVNDVMEVMGSREESISVSIEDVKAEDWMEQVYKPDIVHGRGKVFKKPGYEP
jgi:4-oxalocrotonate tautomerase